MDRLRHQRPSSRAPSPRLFWSAVTESSQSPLSSTRTLNMTSPKPRISEPNRLFLTAFSRVIHPIVSLFIPIHPQIQQSISRHLIIKPASLLKFLIFHLKIFFGTTPHHWYPRRFGWTAVPSRHFRRSRPAA